MSRGPPAPHPDYTHVASLDVGKLSARIADVCPFWTRTATTASLHRLDPDDELHVGTLATAWLTGRDRFVAEDQPAELELIST